jgi:hypothetical protein
MGEARSKCSGSLSFYGGFKMDKDDMMKQFEDMVESMREKQKAWDTLASQLFQIYEAFYNAGFNDRDAFYLTQQFFDKVLKEMSLLCREEK